MREEPIFAICLAGPTGSGKTAIALELAAKLGCEIINADSRQLYADFPIITAQPSDEELSRAPHHLYGFLQSSQKSNACFWANLALEKAREITRRGHVPLLVGGTGFYFQAFLHGMAPIPKIPPEISARWAGRVLEEGAEKIHSLLIKIDPPSGARIHPRDRQRIQRAMEVWDATGKTLSWWHGQGNAATAVRGPLFTLDCRLDELSPRLLERIDNMLAMGALEEASRAWRKCPDPSAPGWSGIGCSEILSFLMGKISEAECRVLWHGNTRAYAKRQLTWFRARKEAIPVLPDAAAILEHPACRPPSSAFCF